VAVALDEAGDRELALEIDDLGAVADQLADLGVRADGEDRVPRMAIASASGRAESTVTIRRFMRYRRT
jgi:hypothetical protein